MIKKLVNNKIFAICGAIFCCALWGICTPLVKVSYEHLDATHIPSLLLCVGLQFVFSGLLTIGGYSVASKKIVLPNKNGIKGITIVSILQTVLQYAFLYIGLSQTTSVKGAILKSTDVFMVVLISSLIFKMGKLTAKKLISCIIGFLGIIVMNLDGLSLNINPVGDGLVLLAIVSYSFSVIATKIFAQNENPIILCGYQMTLGGTILTLVGIVLHGKFDFVGMLPVLICLSLIYAISYTLWTILLKYNPASNVTIYSFMTPIFGVAFSALLLSENGAVATINLIISLFLVCGGIILWGYEKKPYTVTFNNANGSVIIKEYTKKGVLITEPKLPYRRGTIFEGWYVAENSYVGNKKWDFNKDILSGNTTLMAKWKMSDTFFEPDINAATRTEGSNLRVMSFNILSEYYNNKPSITGRDKLIIDMLNRYSPDIIGMQEVTDKWYEVLNEKLGKYRFVNKDNNKVKNVETNYSTIAYNTEKYDVIEYDQIPYTINDNVNCRNVTWALFEEKSNGKRFIVTSTHWNLSSGGRLNNADQLKKIVIKLQEQYNVPIFSTGDYNTVEFQDEYNNFIDNSKFIDAKFTAKKKGLVCYTHHLGDGTGSREDYSSGYWKLGVVSFRLYSEKSIDHIFCSPSTKILYYDTIVDKYILDASDHCPIYIDAAI